MWEKTNCLFFVKSVGQSGLTVPLKKWLHFNKECTKNFFYRLCSKWKIPNRPKWHFIEKNNITLFIFLSSRIGYDVSSTLFDSSAMGSSQRENKTFDYRVRRYCVGIFSRRVHLQIIVVDCRRTDRQHNRKSVQWSHHQLRARRMAERFLHIRQHSSVMVGHMDRDRL